VNITLFELVQSPRLLLHADHCKGLTIACYFPVKPIWVELCPVNDDKIECDRRRLKTMQPLCEMSDRGPDMA